MSNKLDNLAEELSAEPRSPDYDSVLSSMLQIDSKAREIAKGYGVPVEQIYRAIDFYPKGFVSEFGANQDGSDFAYSDVMRDLQVLEKQIVPASHRKYGGIRLPEFMRNDRAEASFPLPGKEKPVPVGGVNKGDVVLKEKMGIFDYVANFIRKHPKLSAAGGIALLFGLGYATNDTVKDKTDKTVENIYEKLFSKSSSKSVGTAPAAVVIPAANESVKSTETPYQFKPGIEFFGSEQYKQKIQVALDEIKRTNITEYNEVMLYLEKIRQNPDNNVGKGSVILTDSQLFPSNLIHEKEHIKQANIEPWKSYYEGKSGWFNELDAVKKQVGWEAEAYNYTNERKQQQIKNYIEQYKGSYPEEYAKWISDS